jgi:prophage regulatory protein
MSAIQQRDIEHSAPETSKPRRTRPKAVVEDPMIRPRELVLMLGLDYSTIYRAYKAGRFPPPIQLTDKAIGWRRSVVEKHLAERQRKAEGE